MMMGLRREDSLLIALSWITFSGFTLGFNARIRVNREIIILYVLTIGTWFEQLVNCESYFMPDVCLLCKSKVIRYITRLRLGTTVKQFYLDSTDGAWKDPLCHYQHKTADRGGNKALLHNRWTSMLTARLFCGDEKNHLSYTELLDVAVLEDTEWQNTTIYTLFKNEYNLRAVCVYKMSDILHVFRSNEFTSATDPFSSPRPGECVQNSQALSPALLRFMGNRPELKAWVTPAQNPLLFSHHHYTHLQVDRVESSNSENGYHDVLLMSLDSGKVHKILDQDGKPFIIAEYEPFKTRTHISSMLLDSTTKKLFVSSSSEVIQIDLRNCSMYGNQCQPCVMARDPYCIWDWTECSHNNRSLKQDVNYGNEFICEKDDRTIRKRHTLSIVSEDSIFFLKCPMESQHASYAWYHQGMRRECDLIERDCILLFLKISSMQEGVYECIASENGYNWTVVENANIYAGTVHGLYMLNSKNHPTLKLVNVTIMQPECLNSENIPNNCTELWHPSHIIEPSLHVGNSLYYTVSATNSPVVPVGTYRWAMNKSTFQVAVQNEQRYFKIIANNANGPLDGKVYSFYIEKNKAQGPEKPIWVPLVSQFCMADRGGTKSMLQNRWTSMLTARLFCGDVKNHLSYTELLDVAVLEDVEWPNTTIYTLFKNEYNLTALCVYTMSDILHVFNSNKFTSNADTFTSPTPGQCVHDSQTLLTSFMRFMESRPEMKQWIKPTRDPLMFKHHHYTHLQVDRVKSNNMENGHHDVLLMSLECGKVHKILEQDGKPFIIAEYKPFNTRTHISSMLLDSVNKKLFVSSSTEVVQIKLDNCSVYGKSCELCALARDPYCSWHMHECSNIRLGIQNVTHGIDSKCKEVIQRSDFLRFDNLNIIPQDSKFYYKCPKDSQHASYVWEHEDRQIKCVCDEENCFLLIDRMSKKDVGKYYCIASENDYSRTIVSLELQMNSGSDTRTSHAALACFLLLIYVIY
ncbi:semaphorin-7A-like [Silurus meridionalis]|nr:semaphorin-7A-like [Silurus meridionalis]